MTESPIIQFNVWWGFLYLPVFYFYFVIFGLNISDAIYPNISAAELPTAAIWKPPRNSPINPSLSTASVIPFHRLYPNPVSGTDAPHCANSRSGLYIPRAPSTTPVQTSMTIILPGRSLVLSINIWARTHIIPPTTNAFT